MAGIDLELLLSAQHERVVRNDNTVTYKSVILQLPTTPARMHFVRCPVQIHQFPNGTLGVSYQKRLLARYNADGDPLASPVNKERGGPAPQGLASTNQLSGALHRTAAADPQSVVFRPRSHQRARSDGRKTKQLNTVESSQLSTQRRGHL